MRPRFTSYGGGIDQTAIIGHPPESRTWKPGDPMFEPVLGEGVRVEAFVTVDAGEQWPTWIGPRTWLMKHVHIGHDAVIGKDCEFAPGVVIGGYVRLGDRVKAGINACVLPFVTIGDDVTIGAGAVVTKDYAEGVLVGNPARALERRADRCETCRGGGVVPGTVGLVACSDCLGSGSSRERVMA